MHFIIAIYITLQVAQGDSDAADVIMNINDKVNNDKLTAEQEQLLNQQTREAESVEDRQLKEKREMNRNLDDEMLAEEIDIDTQIQQQKRLVGCFSQTFKIVFCAVYMVMFWRYVFYHGMLQRNYGKMTF